MPEVAHLDIETRSPVNLTAAGLYKYFADERTEVIAIRWRIGNRRGNGKNLFPLTEHIREGGTVSGWNIAFDREGWNTKVGCRMSPAVIIKPAQSDCSMARAGTLALPGKLDLAAKVLETSVQKDKEGHRLMLKMCKPRAWDGDTPLYHETPEQLARLDEYCDTDVETESAVEAKLPPLTPLQRRTWLLDQTINARGVMLDMPFVEKALSVAQVCAFEADKEMARLTDCAVTRTTQVQRIRDWLEKRGVPCASLAKGVIEDVRVTADVLSDLPARRVIELRRASAKSSVAKYEAMVDSAGADDRVRGTLNYHGASTGRWTGRLIQPQNFPRVETPEHARDVKVLHDILRKGGTPQSMFKACELWFENPLLVLSKALRSTIIAREGARLIGGDFSNIEGRVNAWLAGEDWKVEAFKQFDLGHGPDLYLVTASAILGKPIEMVTKKERQDYGKVPELAMGYQGGRRAFQKMGANYGVSVTDETAEAIKVGWRDKNAAIKASWYELQDAGIEAVKYPGAEVRCLNDRIAYKVVNNILWCRLPSGRCLAYANPWITNQIWINEDGEIEVTNRPQVAFKGNDKGHWRTQRLYGGLQCENVVQAIACDLLVEGMFRVEAAGYGVVLTVHDEILTEVPKDFGSTEEFGRLMVPEVEWAEGLPMAVSAWSDVRYTK